MTSKKGAELALNVIIIAAIGLLVLAILLFIFSGKISTFSKGTSTCESLGGVCGETPCNALTPPQPALFGGVCPVIEGASAKYCCKSLS